MALHRGTAVAARWITLLGAAALLAACASSGSDSGTTPGSAAASDISNVEKAISELSSPTQSMPKPTDPVKRVAGGNVVVIAAGLSTEGSSVVASFVQDGIRAAGLKIAPTLDGKYDPTVQAGLIRRAVQDQVDGIILVAINPSTVADAVNSAIHAKIPVVDVSNGPDRNSSAIDAPGVVRVDPSFEQIGTAQGYAAIAAASGSGKIGVLMNEEYGGTIVQNQTAVSVIEAQCPACQVEKLNMSMADLSQPTTPFFTAFLSKNPDVKVVVAPFDSATVPIATAATQKGRTDVQFVGNGAFKPVPQMIKDGGSNIVATVAYPMPYMGWSAVDQMLRLLNGMPTWDSSSLPVAMVTKDNIEKFDITAVYAAPDFDFHQMYSDLWTQ